MSAAFRLFAVNDGVPETHFDSGKDCGVYVEA
jgi:hypothetical protein